MPAGHSGQRATTVGASRRGVGRGQLRRWRCGPARCGGGGEGGGDGPLLAPFRLGRAWARLGGLASILERWESGVCRRTSVLSGAAGGVCCGLSAANSPLEAALLCLLAEATFPVFHQRPALLLLPLRTEVHVPLIACLVDARETLADGVGLSLGLSQAVVALVLHLLAERLVHRAAHHPSTRHARRSGDRLCYCFYFKQGWDRCITLSLRSTGERMAAIILPKTTVTMRNERSETSPHVCPRQGFLILVSGSSADSAPWDTQGRHERSSALNPTDAATPQDQQRVGGAVHLATGDHLPVIRRPKMLSQRKTARALQVG